MDKEVHNFFGALEFLAIFGQLAVNDWKIYSRQPDTWKKVHNLGLVRNIRISTLGRIRHATNGNYNGISGFEKIGPQGF